MLGRNRHYVLTSMLPLHGWRNWRRTLNRGISRNVQWFFRFRTICQQSWNFEIISPFLFCYLCTPFISFSFTQKHQAWDCWRVEGGNVMIFTITLHRTFPHSFPAILVHLLHILWLLFIAYSYTAMHSELTHAHSPYSQILLCFKQNRHGFHTIRKEKPTAAALINISFPIVAAALVCI